MSLLTERNGWAKIWLCWKWVTPQFVVHAWPLTQVWPELRNLNVQNEWWRVLCLHVQCAVKRAKGPCLTFSLCAGTLESMFLIKQVMSWTFHTKEIDNSNQGRHKTKCMIRGGKRVKMTWRCVWGRAWDHHGDPIQTLHNAMFPHWDFLKKDRWNLH